MKKIYFTIIAILLCAGTMLKAQSYSSLTYSMGFATGDLADFISQTSFRGLAFDYRHTGGDNVGLGVSFAWNVFYEEKAYETYTRGNASLTGRQFRYSNFFPMLVAGDYYFSQGDHIDPFVGLGTGVIYTLRNTDMNVYTLEEEAWNFALTPEVGLMFNGGFAESLTVVARYNYGFAAGDLPEPQSYISLNVGFVFKQ